MNPDSAALKWFDKAFLVLALLLAGLVLYFSFQQPDDIIEVSKLDALVGSIEAHRTSKVPVEIGYTFRDNSAKSSFALKVPSKATSDAWAFYPAPTPRPFKAVVVTTPPPVKASVSKPAEFVAVSVPGKVELRWKRPETKDVVLRGYFVFRVVAGDVFGSFNLEGKHSIAIGDAQKLETPVAGPMKEEAWDDTTISPETGYTYVIVAFGLPARPLMKDGKPVLDPDGNPVLEVVSEQPVAAVSDPLTGKTVEETQIFLRGVVAGVAANFTVFRWDRENKRWQTATATNIAIGKEIVATGKDRLEIVTGWTLHSIDRETLDIDGRRRTLDFALLVSSKDYSIRKKAHITSQREPDEPRMDFAPPVPVQAWQKSREIPCNSFKCHYTGPVLSDRTDRRHILHGV